MKIQWMGHASFLLTSASGTRVLTDPYASGELDVHYERINEPADVVTVSHDDRDHNCLSDVRGHFTVIKGSGCQMAQGIRFQGVGSFHDHAETRPNTAFCWDMDGLRICHLGDLGQHLLDPSQIAEIGKVDILMIPVGNTYTIGPREALEILRQLRPSVAIPMHFKTAGLDPDSDLITAEAFTDECEKEGLKVRIVHKTVVEVNSEGLPAETEIWVLPHAR